MKPKKHFIMRAFAATTPGTGRAKKMKRKLGYMQATDPVTYSPEKTKSDEIRGMSDIELMEFIKKVRDRSCWEIMNCTPEETFALCKNFNRDCGACIVRWLKTTSPKKRLSQMLDPDYDTELDLREKS